jgi:hypothetical protein
MALVIAIQNVFSGIAFQPPDSHFKKTEQVPDIRPIPWFGEGARRSFFIQPLFVAARESRRDATD